jgi:poly-beta-1,6-N-acetyl-D-glucosamine synthase
MPNEFKYVIITPVRDEVEYIEKTISSVVSQTVLPYEWIIVDDGSTDGTSALLANRTDQYSWIKVIHRGNRGFRAAGGGVIDAFNDGYDTVKNKNWDFIVKLDGDLAFEADYFEKCFERFAAETRLGLAGGTVLVFKDGEFRVDAAGDPPFHVRGATKIYRRQCWDMISPLVKAPGWDTIDEVKANMLGWTTRTFRDLNLVQLKATGGADSKWSNWFKNGRANYITGYHPLFMVAKCVKRLIHKPLLLGATALWAGFSSGYLRNIGRVEDREAIRYLRKEQIRCLTFRNSIYR